jgi:hypothetical protein
MKNNMGAIDKTIRIVIAAVIFVLYYFTDLIPGTLGNILIVVGAILILTSIISFCPLYRLIGISTCKKD